MKVGRKVGMNEWMNEWMNIASYADLLRALLSLGEERVMKLPKTSTREANEQD